MSGARLTCVGCGRTQPLTSVNVRCQACNEPFEVQYAIGRVSPDSFNGWRAPTAFDGYAAFYPFLTADPAISLGEGRTTLLRSRQVGRELGLDQLFFKNETENPTWTFKDRGTACSIQHAAALGFTRVGTLSSGNMGASVAALGRRAGLDTVVLLRAGVPREKVNAIAVYQGHVVLVAGESNGIYEAALAAGKSLQIYFSLADEPMRVEGYKTVAFELFEQLGRRIPDFVAVPVGSGGLCRGILKGFEELQSAGLADRLPVFLGVQPEGCSPIADAYERGLDRIEPFEHARTLDHVLENPTPASGNAVLRKMRSSGGTLIKVSDAAVIDAALLLAREGLFAQPASATALAGIAQSVARSAIPRGALVVSIVTGTGLKYPPVLEAYGLTACDSSAADLLPTLNGLLG
jgi:threonine synthase